MSKLRIKDDPQTLMSFERKAINTEPRADRGPQAGSPLGVVDATGSYIELTIGRGSIEAEWHPVATGRGSVIDELTLLALIALIFFTGSV